MSSEKIWECKIGGVVGELPKGSDGPMRKAVRDAFNEITGIEATFCFSGWGAKIDGLERSVVENREPTDKEVAVVTGEELYDDFMLANLELNSCQCDTWSELTKEDRSVWAWMAQRYVRSSK